MAAAGGAGWLAVSAGAPLPAGAPALAAACIALASSSNIASALDSLLPAKNIASAQNFYQLEGTIIPSQNASDVPGPLPILGVAAAFGFSRKLRKRIKLHKGSSDISNSTGA